MSERLRSPRLFLRELADKDLPFLTSLLSDPEVMAWWPKPLTPEEARAWLARQRKRYADDGHGYWLLAEAFGSRPVGQAGLLKIDVEGKKEWGLGYILAKADWGRGYAVEACSALLLHAFSELKVERVVALIRPGNGESEKVARRLGMKRGRLIEFAGFKHAVWARGPVWRRVPCSAADVEAAWNLFHGSRKNPPSEAKARDAAARGGLVLEEALRLLKPKDGSELEAFRLHKPNGPDKKTAAAHEKRLRALFPGLDASGARAAISRAVFYHIV